MRKILIMATILLLFFISACTNQPNERQEEFPEENDEETNDTEEDIDEEQTNNQENAEQQEENDPEPEVANIEPQYQINENWSIVPMNDTVNEQIVLLTIDDAPDGHALEMAETLAQLDAPAIFFVNGHFLETDEEKETLQKIHDLGFIIGNHTYSHANLSELSESEQKEEIIRVNDMVEEIIGERPKFFRPPFGVYTDYTKQVLDEEHMTYMNWTYGYDWESDYMTKEAIADIMVHTEYLTNGANLLMHDREWTNAALHDIVTGLRDQGYETVDPALIKTMKQ